MTSARSIAFAGIMSFAAAAPVGAAEPVQVTASTNGTEGVLEEVLVTAQRRVTSLQTTAAAISAFNEDMLAARSIEDVQDLGRMSPSMDVSIYQGEAQIYIRGIGYTGLIGGTDSSTAFHLNGIYISRSSGAVPGFFDVER